ncbi:hypothetical protein FOA52_004437 [Chlamydomonas sp. UWO 241]|nr:hypothetical protein FOA52_004437 [Chlamydomonas sp. UWO 241]
MGQRRNASTDLSPIHKLVVANRGEIAARVLSTARRLGVPTVAVYSDADRHARHIRLADEAFYIGGAAARDSYLRQDALLDVCASAGGKSLHPGYGFLSENAAFADACAAAGVAFVGPGGAAIRSMGNKSEAKSLMSAAGVPVVPGYHGHDQSDARLIDEASHVGFPLLIKAVSGGGGKGMKLAASAAEVPAALASARREAAAAFGDDRLLIERYIERPRHVEVQVVADAHGNAVYLFDRDCSLQRRHQKVIEEAPAPGLSAAFHTHIGEAAVRATKACGYVNAGTVEFIVDMGDPSRPFFFMEMNTRLQVEHPVSEEVAGVDLVEWQLRVAAGLPLPMTQEEVGAPKGHAFEARLYAESPRRDFLPGGGVVRRWRVPPGSSSFTPGCVDAATPSTPASSTPHTSVVRVRVDSGVEEGDSVGTFYDPMIAKIIVWGVDRGAALAGMRKALEETQVAGLPVNLPFLQRLAGHPAFESADDLTTAFIKEHLAVLMAPQLMLPRVMALAGVARHLMEVAAASALAPAPASASASAPVPAPAAVRTTGPWDLPDSKRLWGHVTRGFEGMVFPEGEGGPHAHVSVRLKLLSAGDFDASCSGGAAADEAADTDSAGAAVVAPAVAVAVRGAALDVASGRLSAEVDGRRALADVLLHPHGSNDVLCLWLDGCAYELRWRRPVWSTQAGPVSATARAGAAGGGGAGEVAAPLPGRVVKVLVTEGQKVAAGDALVVLEAMKMEHPVKAHRPGVVTGLAVSVGGQVQDGQALMVLRDESKP